MIFLDACIVIYAVESAGDHGIRVRTHLERSADTEFAISALVVQEVLVGALRRGDRRLLRTYEARFSDFAMLDLPLPVFVHAAELRARMPALKTVDAIHLSTARLGGCTALWTNDRRLSTASAGFAVDVLHA